LPDCFCREAGIFYRVYKLKPDEGTVYEDRLNHRNGGVRHGPETIVLLEDPVRWCPHYRLYFTREKESGIMVMRIISRYFSFHNNDFLDWTVTRTGFRLANLVDHIHPFNNPAKYRVFAIEKVVVHKVNEEL
jgi:hypothetical protein